MIRMALGLFLLAATTASSQQIGDMDDTLIHVRPVEFCVVPDPARDPNNPDFAQWTFPSGAPMIQDPRPDNVVIAMEGLAFGFEIRAAGPGRLEDVQVIVEHPAQPGTGKTRHTWQAYIPDDANALSFFGFGTKDEIAVGPWIFTYIHDGKVLFVHQFNVVASAAPDRATCKIIVDFQGDLY